MPPEPIIPASYWVDDALAAGQYPGSLDLLEAAAKVERFLGAGVTLFVDLTHRADRMDPYEQHLAGAARRAFPIVDNGIPSTDEMVGVLDAIDGARDDGEVVYVHCWGGHGRTGTVIGCWLVRHGHPPTEAIERIRELRRPWPGDPGPSPQTAEQGAFVRAWRPGR